MSSVTDKLQIKLARLSDKLALMDDFERNFILNTERKLSNSEKKESALSMKQKKFIDRLYYKYFNSWTI